MADNLEVIASTLRAELHARDEAREKALPRCREAIRCASQSIRAVHRQEFAEAEKLLALGRTQIDEAEAALAGFRERLNTGFLRDAEKELAEGYFTLALVTGKPLPDPVNMKVDAAAYLNGLGEAVGEVRRYLLDAMRKGDLSRGEELLSAMDDIYSTLVTMDYPDGVTGGLRRTTDMVRGVLEKTRSDLTLTIRQKALEDRLGGQT